MRPLPVALAACALFAAPVTLSAQSPPVTRPHPIPPGAMHRPNRNQNGAMYPVVIDGSVLNRYLTTPAPKHTHPPHHMNNGQDVFETHSTNDAK